MQESLVPTFTPDQLRHNAKLIRKYLDSLGIKLTNSTALDVAANGIGYANYNIAKAMLSKQNARSDSTDDYPYGPYAFCTFLADPKKQGLFDIHLPIIKGIILGEDIDGAIYESEAKQHGVTLAFNPTAALLDSLPPMQMVFDFMSDTTIVSIDAYRDENDILKLIQTYRKYGIVNLVLTSINAASQALQDECNKNKVEFRRERDIAFLSLILRTEGPKPKRHKKMTFVPVKEFVALGEKLGLSKKDANHLARWYHELNGGWIEYKLLIKGVMFSEEDTLLDIQRSLYEVFVYSIPDFNIGDKTKNDHWESYINKEIWKNNAERMFADGIYFNQEIADAIGLDYDVGALTFMTERNRYKK